MAQGANAHVKKILPPSLGGMPGEAEIQYYVKATVQRPAFYKENFRAVRFVIPRPAGFGLPLFDTREPLQCAMDINGNTVQEIPFPTDGA